MIVFRNILNMMKNLIEFVWRIRLIENLLG